MTSIEMELPAALSRVASDVEAALEALLPPVEGAEARLADAMRYATLGGGKRLRAFLVMQSSALFAVSETCAARVAAAIEMLHAYSLVHDDLPAMDDDDLRRGKPTCHVAFGEDVAILAGDGLFAEAMRLVLDRQNGDPERVLAALHEIVDAVGVSGMVGGQYMDVAGSEGSPEDIRHLHELKTGRLIGASVGAVLQLNGLRRPATILYRRFAAELGVLFQIVDDILDVTGDEASLGKPQGSDERQGKRTYVSAFGLERARDLATESHRKARTALAETGGRTGTLEQITDYILTRNT
jgi:geranylgeranyl diphosphate synthase type II